MISNNFLPKALFISLTIHTILVCSSYWMKLPELKKSRDKRMEISYRPVNPKTLDIRQHAVKPVQRLDLQNTLFSSNDAVSVKLVKDRGGIRNLTMYEHKPTPIRSIQANHVTITPLTSEKINNPIYTSYQDRIRESIKERVYANYSRLDDGRVYLTFIIASDGSLKAYQIIEQRTKASENLRYISTKSLKEAHFPLFLKGMSLPEYTFNIEIDYQVSE